MRKNITLCMVVLSALVGGLPFAGWAGAAPAPAPRAQAPAQARPITPKEAVEIALKRNLGLAYDRLAPELSGAPEALARSVTEARFFGDLSASGNVDRLSAQKLGLPLGVESTVEAGVGLRKAFFSGTSLETRLGGLLGVGYEAGVTGVAAKGSLQLTVRQALLRGADSQVNRAGVTTAVLARSAAENELRRKAELLAAQVLKAYWDLYAAQANLRIQQVALALAQKTLAETRELIALKRLAESEAVSAEHQVKIQERAVLTARKAQSDLEDRLGTLLGLADPRSLETPALVAQKAPGLVRPAALAALQREALRARGDYLALKVKTRAREEEARAARDLLLPKLDLVGTVGVNGGRQPAADPTTDDPTLQGRVTWSVGLVLEVPLGNQEAKAREELAALSVRRAQAGIASSEQAISEELKVTFRAVAAAEQLVTLSEQAVAVAETKLSNELQKYRAGKSTAQILSLVQGDLVREQQNREQAIAGLHQALVEVWTAAGGLLGRLGSQA